MSVIVTFRSKKSVKNIEWNLWGNKQIEIQSSLRIVQM